MTFYLFYYHVDCPELSEVYSKYETKDSAVKAMVKLAGYSNNKKGELTQFGETTQDYPSMDYLLRKCEVELFLRDHDLYVIFPFN